MNDKTKFLAEHPEYGYNGTIDDLYEKEFSHRLNSSNVYLDHAGTTLYGQSQLNAHFHQLQTIAMNNPHSEQEDSSNLLLIRECVESILSMFESSSRDYSLIFTLNTTHSCQLLASIFPFTSQSEYAYMIDSHNSLTGIRQQVLQQGGLCSILDYPSFIYQNSNDDENDEFRCVFRSSSSSTTAEVELSNCLFAMPVENNFNGLRAPLDQLLKPFLDSNKENFSLPVQRRPSESVRWFTLVDCAKYLSSNTFSLRKYPVDFLVFSFYKIFGYPTGLGALVIRNQTLKYLKKEVYFGGGSVQYISPYDPSRVEYKSGIDAFIHGTIPFTTILAVPYGLELINSRLTYRQISVHTQCLIEFCRKEMLKFNYSNGQTLCLFYGQRNEQTRRHGYSYGPILNFNLFNSQGEFLSCRLIQRIAADHQIVVRVGTFCAPGASQAYLGSREAFEQHQECRRGLFCGTNVEGEDVIDSGRQPLGSVRLSLGWMSRYEDICHWIDFLREVILQGIGLAPQRPLPSITNGNHYETNVILSHIYVYPIKSCGFFSVNEWPLTSMSLLYDREWMIVDQNFNPLTLKRLPFLSQIKPIIDLKENQLILTAKNHSPFILNIEQDSTLIQSSVKLTDGLMCHVYAGEVEHWLTNVLGIYATLARRADHCSMTLANEGAFLLVYEESVRDIQSKLTNDEQISHQRFRANLVVDKTNDHSYPSAYDEDQWERLRVVRDPQIEWAKIGQCQRCSIVNIDPKTGKNQSRLFTRLQTERREMNSLRANFGILLSLSQTSSDAVLRVGDRLEIFSNK